MPFQHQVRGQSWAHLVEMAIKDVKTASNIEKGVMILDKACLVQ